MGKPPQFETVDLTAILVGNWLAMALSPAETGVLLIDAQTFFWEHMHGEPEPVAARTERLLRLADWLDLPVVATFEEPRATKGDLPKRLEAAMPDRSQRFSKKTFDCLADKKIRATLEGLGRRSIAVAGAETDVCVLLSVLALLENGYTVHLLTDCLFSSEANPGPALRRMEAAGAIPTTYKTLAYELTATIDREAWPESWRSKLARDPGLFLPPEDLPRAL